MARPLADFLVDFDEPDFSFAVLRDGEVREDGSLKLGWFELSDVGEEFYQAAYEHGWVLRDFDWNSWATTPEAQAYIEQPRNIHMASEEDLRRLLTLYIRADRFSEGLLVEAFDRGVLRAIVARAAALSGEPSR